MNTPNEMIYEAIHLKNGKTKGKLTFSTGKVIILSIQENIDFHNKISYWKQNNHIK